MPTEISGLGIITGSIDLETPLATADGGSMILGHSYAETVATTTSGTDMFWDNTIPQNTEGDEVITVTHTRVSATSKLMVEAQVFIGEDSNTSSVILMAAIFQDSLADALVAVGRNASSSTELGVNIEASQLTLKRVMASGSTGATTFKLRAGLAGAGVASQARINGANGNRQLGGALVSYIMVTEIAA